MEIRNTFIEGNLDISVESTSLKEEGEPLYNLLINDECYTLSRQDGGTCLEEVMEYGVKSLEKALCQEN